MSISRKKLTEIYAAEGLESPSVLGWPLSAAAEEDRRDRERAFNRGLGADPPPGLAWIRNHSRSKYRPDLIVEGCRSILVSALGYYRDDETDKSAGIRPAGGRIARYARGRDYHKELGNRLRHIARALAREFPDHRFRAFTDIGPLDETWLAEASGLGFKGRHTLAILPRLGSWAVLGNIVSSYPFKDDPGRPSPLSCPEGCRRCIDACPTGALFLPGRLDASRCISYHTIEHKGPLEPDIAEPELMMSAAGDRIFGCDACQEVCPFNVRVEISEVEAFRNDIAGPVLNLNELLDLSNHDEMVQHFAGSPLMRAGREGLVRNACVAAGNSGDKTLIGVLRKRMNDEDAGIGLHAEWAVDKLSRN